jgi:hypothetical protein
MPTWSHSSAGTLWVSLALLLAGCGGGAEPGGSPSAPPPESGAAALSTELPSPPPVAQGPPAGSNSDGGGPPQGAPGPVRPGGSPPGPRNVRFALPAVGQDLSDQSRWERSMRDACREVNEPENCLTVNYQAYRRDASGKRTPIPNPGPNYSKGDNPLFALCEIERIDPPTAADQQIPAGSLVTITIGCDPQETEEPAPAPPSTSASKTPEGSEPMPAPPSANSSTRPGGAGR